MIRKTLLLIGLLAMTACGSSENDGYRPATLNSPDLEQATADARIGNGVFVLAMALTLGAILNDQGADAWEVPPPPPPP